MKNGNDNIIFKSAKYNHVRNDIDTETMTELGTRKHQQDGDEEKTHLCIRYSAGEYRFLTVYESKHRSNFNFFSVAIITILEYTDNKNIHCLKEIESSKKQYKTVNGSQLSLFHILLSNMAYNVIVGIIYLVRLIAISLIQNLLPIVTLKYITTTCIFTIIHILFVLLESVSQMYLTFWANKK